MITSTILGALGWVFLLYNTWLIILLEDKHLITSKAPDAKGWCSCPISSANDFNIGVGTIGLGGIGARDQWNNIQDKKLILKVVIL